MNLFDLIEPAAQAPPPNDEWRPEAPPCLDGIDEIFLNFETTGLKWWDNDRPISISLYAGDRSWYIPFAHHGAGNLDEAVVKEWTRRELRGKLITNINTRFDIHFSRVWGVDLIEQGNTFADVSHFAALLDSSRLYMNLDSLVRDYLHENPMVRLDESRMASYSAGAAQARSRFNVEACKRLKDVMFPKLEEEELLKVMELENSVIPVVVEMEKNGSPLDLEKLALWEKATIKQYQDCCMELWKQTGLKVNPNSPKDDAKIFRHLKLPMTELTAGGAPSFTDDIIKAVDHPTVKLLRHAKKLASLNSKLRKYQKSVGSDGILRFALHQLRAAKDESSEGGETGTITGRFTSTEIAPGVGINVQQVLKPEKQLLSGFGTDFFIRDLHIPAKDKLWLSVDAAQIQYRLFASEAGNPEVLEAYRQDPELSFHKMMLAKFRAYNPNLSYRRCKDISFAKLFAAGPTKLALMLDFITKKEFEELRAQRANRYHPRLATTLEILKIYDKVLPEVAGLLRYASELADSRGYIKTILGRRIRFPMGPEGKRMRLHKAFNGRIQGSEADYVKSEAVQLYQNRKELGITLRFSVHDEFDADIDPDPKYFERVKELLGRQLFPSLRVPILWDSKVGSSWGDTSRDEIAKIKEEMHL